MLLRLEVEVARVADLLQHDVGGFVGAVRHVGVEDIGQRFEDALDRLVQFAGAAFQTFHVAAQRGRFRFQRRRVGAGALLLSDLARQSVAARLLILQRGQRSAAFGIEGQDFRRGRRQHAAREGSVEAGGVGANGANVMHGSAPGGGGNNGGGCTLGPVRPENPPTIGRSLTGVHNPTRPACAAAA